MDKEFGGILSEDWRGVRKAAVTLTQHKITFTPHLHPTQHAQHNMYILWMHFR